MAAIEGTTEPDAPARRFLMSLEEAAWLYQADQVRPEDLPMTAAEALAAGVDTPTLCELAGLSRNTGSRDIRDAFELALAELGIVLPDAHLARRYALRRLAMRFAAGEVDLAELASDYWWELEIETTEEQAFVALLPPCACCIEYTLGLDEETWEAQLRIAALALASCPTVGPDS
ncbi:hypothetical protein ACFWDQ_36325 [Streptomyces sp. NPDC060053]|uniref:hypothetical protein n=1 Tax=Streptomyces sp. NPDC060053 TaxID=3347047 RepID=UPI0036B6F181